MYDSATLLSITSEEEQRFIEKFRKDQGAGGSKHIWLGGRKSGTWKWDDGSSYDYKNWSGGEELGKNGVCNYLNSYDNKWYDVPCEKSSTWQIDNFVCKKSSKYRVHRSF